MNNKLPDHLALSFQRQEKEDQITHLVFGGSLGIKDFKIRIEESRKFPPSNGEFHSNLTTNSEKRKNERSEILAGSNFELELEEVEL
jgi:hypothetical protein